MTYILLKRHHPTSLHSAVMNKMKKFHYNETFTIFASECEVNE